MIASESPVQQVDLQQLTWRELLKYVIRCNDPSMCQISDKYTSKVAII